MPNIYNAPVVQGLDSVGQLINVACEVQQLLGNNWVRVAAMSATYDLKRGKKVIDTGAPISIPVGGDLINKQGYAISIYIWAVLAAKVAGICSCLLKVLGLHMHHYEHTW